MFRPRKPKAETKVTKREMTLAERIEELARQGLGTSVMSLLRQNEEPLSADHFRRLVGAAVTGAVLGKHHHIVEELKDRFDSEEQFIGIQIYLANVQAGKYNFDDIAAKQALRSRILKRLIAGHHFDDAVKLLKHHFQDIDSGGDNMQAVKGRKLLTNLCITLALQDPKIFSKKFDKMIKELGLTEKVVTDFGFKVIGYAATGNTKELLALLDNYDFSSVHFYSLIRAVIIVASKCGHHEVVVPLCEKLKTSNFDPERYFATIMLGVESALKYDNYILARDLIQKVPLDFAYKFHHLQWSEERVESMFRAIRDPLICYQLANCSEMLREMRDGVAVDTSPRWLLILKAQYYLEEMSDQGFRVIMTRPDLVALIAVAHIRPVNPNGVALQWDMIRQISRVGVSDVLSEQDLKIFIRQMNPQVATDQRVNMHRLMSRPLIESESESNLACFREIKSRVLEVCTDTKLRGELAKLNSLTKIYKRLLKYSPLLPKGHELREAGLNIFHDKKYADVSMVQHILKSNAHDQTVKKKM